MKFSIKLPNFHLTPEEHLNSEHKATTKSEYLDRQIYAMSGASRKHNLIGGNIFGGPHVQVRDRACEVYANDMRVQVTPIGLYAYPDVVVCDEPRFEDTSFDTLLNPPVLDVEPEERGTTTSRPLECCITSKGKS